MPPEPEPEPAQSPEPERTIQGSVIGYRAWRIVDWQLYGTGVNRAWVPGVNEATCDAGDLEPMSTYIGRYWPKQHPAPAVSCHCGITALARFTTSDEHWHNADVFGAIEAWGEEGQVTRPEPGDVADAAGIALQIIEDAMVPEDAALVLNAHRDESGGFILHRNGFRSRYGKLVLLALDDDWPVAKTAAVRALAKEHAADVCKREHLEDAAKEHGQLVDEELLEWVAKDEGTDHGGYFIPPLWVSHQYFGGVPQTKPAKPPKRIKHLRRRKGVKLTLKTAGPPSLGKHVKGDLARDKKGDLWACLKSGTPGTWSLYDETEPTPE